MRNQLILLVEDSLDDVLLIQRALNKGHIIYQLVVVHDGVEALEFLFGEGKYVNRDVHIMPEVILLDLKMPKMSGLEVLQRIRGDGRTNLLPVVILTGSKEEQDLYSCYKLGVNSYICKPVDYNQFSSAIQQLGSYWLMLNQTPSKRGTYI